MPAVRRSDLPELIVSLSINTTFVAECASMDFPLITQRLPEVNLFFRLRHLFHGGVFVVLFILDILQNGPDVINALFQMRYPL